MKFVQSLRFRIITACVLFAVVVTVLYSFILTFGLRINEDELFNWYIAEEADQLVAEYNRGNLATGQLSVGGYVLIGTDREAFDYLGTILVDEETLLTLQQSKSLDKVRLHGPRVRSPQGHLIVEFHDKQTNLHVLQATLSDPENPALNLYYIVDISRYDFRMSHGAAKAFEILGYAIIAILLLAIVIGYRVAKKVISPLTRLSGAVDKLGTGDDALGQDHYYKDEVGFLARRIDQFLLRIKRFVEREKSFARDASHELRTPVTSSQAALDLALSLPQGQDPKMQQVLGRIGRANKDMTHLIETFLLLGREEDQENLHDKEDVNLQDLALTSLNKNAYLRKSGDIRFASEIDPALTVRASRKYLSVVVDNLVRNAFQHTEKGSVTISGDEHGLRVIDTGTGFPVAMMEDQRQPETAGIGLSIVERICKLKNWRLRINSAPGEGTSVSVHFH